MTWSIYMVYATIENFIYSNVNLLKFNKPGMLWFPYLLEMYKKAIHFYKFYIKKASNQKIGQSLKLHIEV